MRSPRVLRWILTDHRCRACGGRVLQATAGAGPSGGGNPLFCCADCGISTSSMTPASLCWCGLKTGGETRHICVHVNAARADPVLREAAQFEGYLRADGTAGVPREVLVLRKRVISLVRSRQKPQTENETA